MAQAARGAIPQNAPWLAEYLHEMTVFPNGKHDDQVDSTAQFLDWFKTRCRIPVSSNITAERPKRPSGAASRSPPKPYGSPALYNGSKNRKNANEPSLRRLLSGKHNLDWLW
jgi:hypothetical protein